MFESMSNGKKNKGTINSKKFMAKIKKLNQIFDNDDHHDSHEFLIWLLNHVNEELQADLKDLKENGVATLKGKHLEGIKQLQQNPLGAAYDLVSDLFEGKLISKTTCVQCENGGEREETFLALSVDIEKGSSLNHCIK